MAAELLCVKTDMSVRDSRFNMDNIKKQYGDLRLLPFPKSLYTYKPHSQSQAMPLALAYADGCIQSFMKSGSLSPEKIKILQGSADIILASFDIEDSAGKDYLQRLYRICLMVTERATLMKAEGDPLVKPE